MKFAICNELFENWPWERVCEYAASLGYTGLEVSPFTLAGRAEDVPAERRHALRHVAESHGLSILGLHWLLVKPPGLYITSPDAAVRNKTAEYFVELVRLCHDLGGQVMVIGSPKQRSLLPGVTREQALAYAQEVFSPCLPLAQKLQVTLAMEPLSPKETDFLNTAAETIELIERIAHPRFRLNLDVKAMSAESKPIPQIIRESKEHIAHVQVNDPNLLGPGMGDVQYEPIIAALREAGYDGWLSVEAFDFKPGPERIASESIAYLKRVAS